MALLCTCPAAVANQPRKQKQAAASASGSVVRLQRAVGPRGSSILPAGAYPPTAPKKDRLHLKVAAAAKAGLLVPPHGGGRVLLYQCQQCCHLFNTPQGLGMHKSAHRRVASALSQGLVCRHGGGGNRSPAKAALPQLGAKKKNEASQHPKWGIRTMQNTVRQRTHDECSTHIKEGSLPMCDVKW
ncbi:hypothetical protein V5799_013709 [Amblyomma americanum]|uniref:C2H2-type domain-containing protein n=1 Tax=Amblyomma americanum TaxID=6943 RepID=A0AAQ4E550_AMBAM